jgi:hypothetical protein
MCASASEWAMARRGGLALVAANGGCKQVLQKIAINGALVAVLWRTEKVDAGMSAQQAER